MKQNKATRIFALLLSALLALSVVACGKGDGGSAGDGSTGQAPAETSQGGEESKAPAEESAGGTEAKAKITVGVYDRGNFNPAEGTVEDNRWTRWINENAPVEVQFVAIPRSEPGDRYATLLASDSAPDIIVDFDQNNLGRFLANGSLMPIDDAVQQYSTVYKDLLERYPGMRKLGTVNGQQYYITRAIPDVPNHVTLIRSDWLEKLNLQMPTTADELYEVARAFAKDDPDGNGEDDTYGYAITGNTVSQIDFMFGLYGGDMFLKDGDQIYCPWERLYAAYDYRKRLFDDGIVSPDSPSDTTGEQSLQDFINGKLGIYTLNTGAQTGLSTVENFYQNNPDGDVKVMPLPSSQFGQFNTAITAPLSTVGAVNASCKNVEAVMQYLDWINTEDVYNMLMYGGEEYCTQDENGNWIPKDQEKFTTEVYGTDYAMLTSTFDFPRVDLATKYDGSTKAGAKMIEIVADAYKYYLGEYEYTRHALTLAPVPVRDSETTTHFNNTYGGMMEYYYKAIFSGDEYTVEMAEADARKLVETPEGELVKEFYENWFANALATDGLVTLEDYNKFKQ